MTRFVPVYASRLRVGMLILVYQLAPPQQSAHLEHTIYAKCANTIRITQSRWVAYPPSLNNLTFPSINGNIARSL
jgi:hypothetical protein